MEAGKVIGGKYRLRREIGKGAMGSVWAAVHESLGRSVAVKFLRPTGVNPETAAARFVAEARMAAAVKHRFVVDIFDFGITEDGVSYMVLDLLEGEELGERMYYGPPMLVRDAIRFMCQALSGLEAVHDAGIVHRDLKPENIFIIQDAEGPFPTLLDFGISKMDAGTGPPDISLRPPRMGGGRPPRLTLPGTVIGTPWYMAPEQLRGMTNIDARADIFGMGVILWEWLVGRVPYDDDNIGDLMVNLLQGGPPELFTVRPELGKPLAEVLSKSMATKREDRFESAMAMRKALHDAGRELPQAWTIVQKSIVTMTSAEVLGVKFPSEAPTHMRSESFGEEPLTAVDDLVVAKITEHCAPSPVPNASPVPDLPVPPPAGPTAPDTMRPWLKRGRQTALRLWSHVSADRYRVRAFASIGVLSVLLLIGVAVFSGKQPVQRLPPSEVLLPSAVAQSGDVQRVAEAVKASAAVNFERAAHSVHASGEAASVGAELANDPEAGDYLPTDIPELSAASTLEPDSGVPAPQVKKAAEKTHRKRRPRRRRAKKKRLFRSLDF